MSLKPKPVTMQYFGYPIGNGQDPDEPYDHSAGTRTGDGLKIGGKGAQGGGSKPTPQAAIMKRGQSKIPCSYPKNSQKIRG
jgi:hypothetical protein